VKRVLVVEDEPAVRALILASLAGCGCEVEAVGDGASALEKLSGDRPDVVLLDIGLPGMNGGEVLRRLRAEKRTAKTPVVLVTGLEPPEGLKPDAVLHKPFTPALLRESLAAWLT
jgi:CheY-like chemotaxis protein